MIKDKIKFILKNKYLQIILITILAAIVRLISINRETGLWYDEMITYILSSKDSFSAIMQGLLKEEYHMPLYYFYINIWTKLFGTNDIILRLSSAIWGILTIPALYILGSIYKSKKVGCLLALIGSLSPILIYYSQEFRFYALAIFLATVSVIFLLKSIDAPNKTNLFFLYSTNLILIYIYSLSIIFVGLEILLLLIHFFSEKKEFLKNFTIITTIFFILTIPYCLILLNFLYTSNQVFVDAMGWAILNNLSILFILNDLLSPFITCYYGHDPNAYFQLIQNPATISLSLFLYLPCICLICGLIFELLNLSKKSKYMLIILFSFMSIELLLAYLGNISLISRYTLIVVPIILLMSASGILSLKNKFIKYAMIGIILTSFSYFALENNKYPNIKVDGVKPPADILMQENPDNDYLIATERSEILKKYVKRFNFIDFDSHKIIVMDKTKQENLKIFDKNFVKTTNIHNSTKKLVKYFLDSNPTPDLQNFVNNQISIIPKNKYLYFVEGPNYYGKTDNNSMIMYTLAYINGLISEKEYRNTMFLRLNEKINFDLKNALKNNISLKEIEVKTTTISNGFINCRWDITIYKKL